MKHITTLIEKNIFPGFTQFWKHHDHDYFDIKIPLESNIEFFTAESGEKGIVFEQADNCRRPS